MGPPYRKGIRQNFEYITARRLRIITNLDFGLEIDLSRFLDEIK